MKTIKTLSLIALVAGLGFSSAFATIDLSGYGAAPSNSGDGTIATWVTLLVNNYNAANNPDLPAPTLAFKVDPANGQNPPSGFPGVGGTSITIATGGYDYLALHWGNGQSAVPYELFYIGTAADIAAGSVTISNNQNGLSWYSLWDPTPTTPSAVPEPSTIVAGALLLFPLAIATFRSFRQGRLARARQ
jgi:hypothetical protein